MPVFAIRRSLHAAAALLFLAASGTARADAFALVFQQAVYGDGSQEQKPLLHPQGVACSDGGRVVVADTGNQRLLSYDLRDGRVAGGTEIKLAQLTYPIQLQLDSKGLLLALDGKTRKIVRVDASGTFQGYVDVRGVPGTVVPGSIALGPGDEVFVLDVAGRRVLALGPGGAVKRQIELPKEGTFTDIAVDAAGMVYAVDAVNAAVWSAERDGTAVKPLTRSMKERMSFPAHMIARKGRLYLVDQNGDGVVALGTDGSFQGRQLAMGWGDGAIYYPAQLCMTGGGQVYLADRYNNRVQYFTLVK